MKVTQLTKQLENMALSRSFKSKTYTAILLLAISISLYTMYINWEKSTSQILVNKSSQLISSQSSTGFPSKIGSASNTGSLSNAGSLSNTESPSNTGLPSNTGSQNNTNSPITLIASDVNANLDAIHDSITLFVRLGGKLAELRKRFYCMFYRSSVLFWPASLGKTVIVLDEESELDHRFAYTVRRQIKKYFPDRELEILYEPLPSDPTVLDFPGSPKTPGYNRQLWSSFFIDHYTSDSIIAWMDTDAWFGAPVTKSTILQDTKVRVLGTECSVQKRGWVSLWMHSTEVALGLPYVADFMTFFPAYIYRDTFTHCREYILKRFNTSNFEKAFKQFYTRGQYISPVIIILNYAWYFERDRYAWNLQICTNLTQYNKRLPSDHTVGPEHLVDTLPMPQTAFHAPQMPNMGPYVQSSYCLSHEAAGNVWAKCSNYSASLRNNLVLFVHDIVRLDMPIIPPQCSGARVNGCFQILERHYSQVGSEIKQNARKMDWNDLEIVGPLRTARRSALSRTIKAG